jgi:hypothetical protein
MKPKKSDLKLAREVASLIRRAIELSGGSVEHEALSRVVALKKRGGNSHAVNDSALILEMRKYARKLWEDAGWHVLYSERPVEMHCLISDVLTGKRTVRGGDYDDLIVAVYFDLLRLHIKDSSTSKYHYSVWKKEFEKRWPNRNNKLPEDRALRRSLKRLGCHFAPKYERN